MKKRKLIFTTVFLLGCAGVVYANPIVLFPNLYGFAQTNYLLKYVAPIALLIEYLAIRLLLRKWIRLSHVLPAFILINIITFPITQLLGFMFGWGAELFPLLLEPIMYKTYFRKKGIEVPNLWIRIIGANLISFTIGVIAYDFFEPFVLVIGK